MKHLDYQIKDFNQQFAEQVKSFDSKVIVDSSILSNVLDLYKRRATIEQDYAENLLKLSSSITQRNNLENIKRPKWKNYSPVKVLNSLLASTEHTARAHKNLGDIYGKQMTQRVMDMQDDCLRLTKRSTDILQRRHSEILNSLNQLAQKQKNYVKCFNDADECRRKADRAMEQLDREVIRSQEKKRELDKNPKIKKFKEEYMEKYKYFKDKQIESTIARNKYIIHLVSIKDAIDHFYTNELSAVIKCSQYGFHNNLTRLSMNHTSCEDAMTTVHTSISKLFKTMVDQIDTSIDADVFFNTHKSIFTLKEQLHFSPAKDDNINKIVKSEKKVEDDLKNMHVRLDAELKSITKGFHLKKAKIDELSNHYNDQINQFDYDVVDYICYQSQPEQIVKEKSTSLPRESVSDNLYSAIQKNIKELKQSAESEFFLNMQVYLGDEINTVSLSTKLRNLEAVLSSPVDECDSQSYYKINQQTAVIIGMKSKLFGGDLKKYSLDTKETVPLVVRSCIRLINLYGMRNIGVFRVPGSQVDVQAYKSQFELGYDSIKGLKGTTNDVNLAASLLKLYFRELDPPVFDEGMFKQIVEKYNLVKQKEEAIVEFMKDIVMTLDPAVYATVSYLLSFVSHLSEFSNDNCMDILNLAIIFGPCLMPIPEDQNSQLFHFQTIVNHVAQCLITHRQEIFSKVPEGYVYNRNQSMSSPDQSTDIDCHSADVPKEFFSDSSYTNPEDDSDSVKKLCFKRKPGPDVMNLKRNESTRVRSRPLETPLRFRHNSDSERSKNLNAVAIANYFGKSEDEVDLVVGDSISLSKRINEQWWRGCVKKSNGLVLNGVIPNEYISVLNQEDNISDSTNDLKKSDSEASPSISQRLSFKDGSAKKRSVVSMDSDNDLEFSSRNGTALMAQSLGISPEISEAGDLKSLDSIENIAEIGDVEESLKIDSSTFDETRDKVEKEIVKIRTGSLGRCIDGQEVIDMVDDDLRQTMQGLQKIEQLNVINHRNTIHIDKTLLASKFISPLKPEPFNFFAKDSKARSSFDEKSQINVTNPMEFMIKKPGNVSSLASSFEMSQSAKIIQPKIYDSNSSKSRRAPNDDNNLMTPTPPPIFPKPKMKR